MKDESAHCPKNPRDTVTPSSKRVKKAPTIDELLESTSLEAKLEAAHERRKAAISSRHSNKPPKSNSLEEKLEAARKRKNATFATHNHGQEFAKTEHTLDVRPAATPSVKSDWRQTPVWFASIWAGAGAVVGGLVVAMASSFHLPQMFDAGSVEYLAEIPALQSIAEASPRSPRGHVQVDATLKQRTVTGVVSIGLPYRVPVRLSEKPLPKPQVFMAQDNAGQFTAPSVHRVPMRVPPLVSTPRYTRLVASLPVPLNDRPYVEKSTSGVRLSVYTPYSVDRDALIPVLKALTRLGLNEVETKPVNIRVTRAQTRFYHEQDRKGAKDIARATGASLRDFTGYTPSPPRGTIEVWLPGLPKSEPQRVAQRRPSTSRQSAPQGRVTRTNDGSDLLFRLSQVGLDHVLDGRSRQESIERAGAILLDGLFGSRNR